MTYLKIVINSKDNQDHFLLVIVLLLLRLELEQHADIVKIFVFDQQQVPKFLVAPAPTPPFLQWAIRNIFGQCYHRPLIRAIQRRISSHNNSTVAGQSLTR